LHARALAVDVMIVLRRKEALKEKEEKEKKEALEAVRQQVVIITHAFAFLEKK
jgi:hypothetical protein